MLRIWAGAAPPAATGRSSPPSPAGGGCAVGPPRGRAIRAGSGTRTCQSKGYVAQHRSCSSNAAVDRPESLPRPRISRGHSGRVLSGFRGRGQLIRGRREHSGRSTTTTTTPPALEKIFVLTSPAARRGARTAASCGGRRGSARRRRRRATGSAGRCTCWSRSCGPASGGTWTAAAARTAPC